MITGVEFTNEHTLAAEYLALIRDIQSTLYLIARHAEVVGLEASGQIQDRAERAIDLIDRYIFASQVENGQSNLNFSTFGLGSVMHSAAYELSNMSGSEVGIKVGALNPVFTNRELVNNFLITCGQFISGSTNNIVLFRSFQTNDGTVGLGVFSRNLNLNAKIFREGIKSIGKIQMPIPKVSNSSGVMLVLADRIADLLGGSLHVKHMGAYSGLALKLPKSEQLSLGHM